MPIVLILSGALLILTGVKGDPGQLLQLVISDIKGQNGEKGYAVWMFAILVLGFIGYIKSLQTLSRSFIALVVLVLLLHNRGFFAQVFQFVNPSGPDSSTANPLNITG